jgi:hypothetical protein
MQREKETDKMAISSSLTRQKQKTRLIASQLASGVLFSGSSDA